jgi:hypothetical protein
MLRSSGLLQFHGLRIAYITLSERIPAVNEHEGSVGGLGGKRPRLGNSLSGIGFPCWLEEQRSDPLVLRLRCPSALRVSKSPFTAPFDISERPAALIVATLPGRHFSLSTKASFANALAEQEKPFSRNKLNIAAMY